MFIGVYPDHPLYGPYLRLAVAQDKAEELSRSIRARINWVERTTFAIKHDPKSGKNSTFVESGTLQEPAWPVTISEICHDLRSALDGLVYQLAQLTNPSAKLDKVAFPIFRYRDTRAGKGGRTFAGFRSPNGAQPKIGMLPLKYRARLERLQPYHRRNGGERSALWRLHELNNTDKHRLIPVVAVVPHKMELAFYDPDTATPTPTSGRVRVGFRRIERGTRITLPFIGKANPKMRMHVKMAVDVRFDRGCDGGRGWGVSHTPRGMQESVKPIPSGLAGEFSGHALPPPPSKSDGYYPFEQMVAMWRGDPSTGVIVSPVRG